MVPEITNIRSRADGTLRRLPPPTPGTVVMECSSGRNVDVSQGIIHIT